MGKSSRRSRRKSPESSVSASSTSLSPSSSSDSESSERRRKRKHRPSRHRERSGSSSSSKKRRHSSSSSKKSSSSRKRDDERRRKRRKHRSPSSSDDERGSESEEEERGEPEAVARAILEKFPDIAADLEQLLQMIDNGQGVDVRGIPDKSLAKYLKKLFLSLKLKQNDGGVFLLPPRGRCTLDVIGPTLCSHLKSSNDCKPESGLTIREQSLQPDADRAEIEVETDVRTESAGKQDSPIPPRRRVIGPEMPSRELLAAAAELTEAENLMREADLDADDGLLIGPPPPAMVAEAETANEAERFEEVARITGAEIDKPYDVLGVNWKMSAENMKKRYWKLSLMVHPDKCSHPQAHQAFVKLNQAFKDLQDPNKREAIDEKIRQKEEHEAFKAELRALREAAQWRRLQGISIEGDEELLAATKEPPKRDEWMTTLPPERKPGFSTQSRTFSRNTKEGRGDTSAWTDTPLDKAEKAKKTYLEAYDRTKALADVEERKKSSDADLVDQYNSSRRSVSLVQKHKEESKKHVKKKSKQPEKEKEEWVGQHPWKPWDREKDLAAGRKQANLDSQGMAQGLSSRFSSGSVQRNFL